MDLLVTSQSPENNPDILFEVNLRTSLTQVEKIYNDCYHLLHPYIPGTIRKSFHN